MDFVIAHTSWLRQRLRKGLGGGVYLADDGDQRITENAADCKSEG